MQVHGRAFAIPVGSKDAAVRGGGAGRSRPGVQLGRSIVGWLLALTLALAACAGGGTGPAPAGTTTPGGTPASAGTPGQAATTAPGAATVDPCSLLTTDEVQAKAGDTVSKTEKSDTGCTWWLGKDATSWMKLVVWPHGATTFAAMAADGQPVAGLGDKAFSDGSTLVALKGDTMLQIGSEIVLSNADPAVFTRPLMELALGRL